MYSSTVNISKKHSFFLFGARGTGKSCLLQRLFEPEKILWIDLLQPSEFEILNREPGDLSRRIEALNPKQTHIIIDEIQRIPKLLNLVHHHIESSKQSNKKRILFGLTGSSARKLGRGSANLLAGRALVYSLFPLTHIELENDFNMDHSLQWGTLPEVVNEPDVEIKRKILQAYTHTYLKEEVQAEQLIRKLDPFHLFLSIAAQMSGKIINYSSIARECGASDASVREYFHILEDTLIGFHLAPFHESIRKRQRQNPKFYIFDNGVLRSLSSRLTIPLASRTSSYGDAFENWLICEVYRLISYAENDFALSYLRTKDDAEIDLIIERPGLPKALVEIKSVTHIDSHDLTSLKAFARDVGNSEAFCLSQDPNSKIIDGIKVLPWRLGLKELGLG